MLRLFKAALVFSMGLFLFWSCITVSSDRTEEVDLGADSAWMEFERLEVLHVNDSDRVLDTLYQGAFPSPEDLKKLTLEDYRGVSFVILRGYLDGTLVFEQKRNYDRSVPETIMETRIWLLSVKAQPESLALALGGQGALVDAVVRPLVAGRKVKWTLASEGVVALEKSSDSLSSVVKVKPLKVGEALLTLRHPLDSTKNTTVKVRVVHADVGALTLTPDSLRFFVGGPEDTLRATVTPPEAGQGVLWYSTDPKVASVDSQGVVTSVSAGMALIIAKSSLSTQADSSRVSVVADIPKLEVTTRKGPTSETQVEFLVKSTQAFGVIKVLKWDLDGNGTWDDSLAGSWPGEEVRFDPLPGRYAQAGEFVARFYVRDGEGNESMSQVVVAIGNDSPRITVLRGDTVISIQDSIPMFATVSDSDGKVAQAAWDYEGDGVFDDSTTGETSELKVFFGHRYAAAGQYRAILRVRDNMGKTAMDTVNVKVELDAPVAHIGADTTVEAGTLVLISVKGTDKYGPIVARELKVGDGPFVRLSKQDTAILAPSRAGQLLCVGRVTDDDGLTGVDSLVVTVWKPTVYRLIGTAGPGGSVTPSSVAVDSGASQTFTVTASEGYRLLALIDNGVNVLPSLSGGKHILSGISDSHTVAATFRRIFTITQQAGNGGSFATPDRMVDSATNQTLTVVPQSGYRVDSLFVNGAMVPTSGAALEKNFEYTIQGIASNYTLRATFKRVFKVTTLSGIGGSITPSNPLVDSAGTAAVTLAPDRGYRVDSFFVDGTWQSGVRVERGLPYHFALSPIVANRTFRATFRRYYTVGASVSGTGGALVADSASVDSAGTRTFTITPASGYILAGLTNGTTNLYSLVPGELDKPTTLKLSKVSSNLNVEARFALGVKLIIQCDSAARQGGGHTAPPGYNLRQDGRAEIRNYFMHDYQFVVPLGAVLTVEADSEWRQCGQPQCGPIPFKFWDKDGITVSSTPIHTFTVEKDAVLTGVYFSWPSRPPPRPAF